MPASFLHGVETFEYNTGPQPIIVVKSAVIGLVGSAPLFASASPLTIAGISGTVAGPLLVWDPSWLVAVGQYAIDGNGNIQKITAVVLAAWAATHAYVSQNLIVDANGNTQRCTTAGTSGASAPAWATTIGTTTTDSGVTWTLVALGKAGVTGTVAPTWLTALNATTADGTALSGTLTWTLVALGPLPNLQTPILINSGGSSGGANQSAVFGPMIQGYTIPYALNAIFGQGAGQVIVVNVFDQTKHYTTVSATSFTFPASGNQVINLGHMGVANVLVTNSGATVTYVEGADYVIDHVNGLITALGGSLFAAGATVKVSFNYADASKVADADLVGAITNGVYTGMQAWKLSYASFGFFPKILIAPMYGTGAQQQVVGSQDAVTTSALTTIAGAMRAVALVDSPPATQVATLISNRGLTGNSWNTSSTRIILCGPQETFFDVGIIPNGITISSLGSAVQNLFNAVNDAPFSPWVAGAMAAKDLAQGYWWSPSNTQLIGPLGPDVKVYASILDAAADTNNLNASGIVTAFSAFGTGLRLWGNRSSAYPSITTPDQFISVRRTMDVIEESVMLNMMQYLDAPISNALIAAILASVNAFIRSLIQRGALVAGAASFNPNENPPAQIANGQLVFDIDVMPPPPAERLTFNVFIDTTLLSQLTGNVNAQAPAASATA
jgi:Bacteriophage tail sheath protein